MANEHFFPEIEPFAHGELLVSRRHRVYWESCGNPKGEPILFVHGGPGAGCTGIDRRFFHPEHFRSILFDQRGCGRSTPLGEVEENSIDDLVADIEQLREELEIETWHVFGGSWGSTLALYYAEQHPDRCRSLVLRGIWLLRDEELDWWLYRIRYIQPEIWRPFAEHLPAEERGDLLEGYWRRLNDPDRTRALAAAKAWSIYEGSCCTLLPNEEFTAHFEDENTAWSVARLEAHYFRNVRLDPDDLLLKQVERIRHIPGIIVHGRYDIVCPVKNADDLHRAWPEASKVIVPDAGHSSHEPGITRELIAATERIRTTGSPCL
ncbi:MAG: prolyl aminopeptidase [Planctomycetota bacterium]|jgi:proline iminopeptidase